jgi:hypothetical protein
MRKNKITNFLLSLIAIALITIAIRPYLAPILYRLNPAHPIRSIWNQAA